MNKKSFSILLILAVTSTNLMNSCSAQIKPPELPEPADDSGTESFTKADYSLRFYSLDGKKKLLDDFKRKVIFLNTWATWCPPCIEEMPSIQRLYDKVKDMGIILVLISPEKEEAIKKFISKKGYNFNVYLLKDDLPKVFYSGQIPTTYIIDKEGNIVFTHIGYAIWDDESVVEFLEKLNTN